MNHLVNHIQRPTLVSDNTLHVVGVCSNPVRYHSRYRLAREWYEAMRGTCNVKAYLVETAFGDRQHEVTESADGTHLQLRTQSEIWLKENMINLGVRHLLPRDWKYVAWVDADVFFRDPSWAQEALHQLQHCPVIQPWQSCADLDHHGSILSTHTSFGALHQRGERMQKNQHEPYAYGHSGFAWAATRGWWEAVGGLVDFCILGSADHHMAWGMIGEVEATIPRPMSPAFHRRLGEWQARAVRADQRQVGYSPGTIEHKFHGPKAARRYQERWQILVNNHFDPDADLVYDDQGLIRLVGRPKLEQAIRRYNRERIEDSIES